MDKSTFLTPKHSRKNCAVCGERIAGSALKCIHCDSFLDWRRHLQFSTSVLALLVALVSVTATTAPALHGIWKGNNSAIEVGGLVSKGRPAPGSLVIRVANNGTRMPMKADAYIDVGEVRTSFGVDVTQSMPGKVGEWPVSLLSFSKASESALIDQLVIMLDKQIGRTGFDDGCRIKVLVTNFDNSVTTSTGHCRYIDLFNYVNVAQRMYPLPTEEN